jgi:hypothetical protein
VVDRVGPDPRACVIRAPELVVFWAQSRDVTRLPLVRFIEGSFHTVRKYDGLELMVRNGRPPDSSEPDLKQEH